MGRPSWRSSFLGHWDARLLAENRRELRNRKKPELARQPTFRPRERVHRAHSAGSRKSRLCQSASQIIVRIAMLARKIWASQADDRFHLSQRYAHGQQFSSKPQIDDAPINLRKAFLNVPTLQPTLINTHRPLSSHARFLAAVQWSLARMPQRRCGMLCHRLRRRAQQILGGAGQDRASVQDFDPRGRTGNSSTLRLLIGKAGQSSQVAPVGAGPIASVSVSQLSANNRGYNRFHGSGADTNPSLEVPWARLKYHTRLMPMGSHPRQNISGGLIQVQENIAGVAILGVGENVEIKALKITTAQKAQHRCSDQMTHIPHSFPWTNPSSRAMDQANEIEIIGHGRQLAANCVQSQKESVIGHAYENAAVGPCDYNQLSTNGNSPLNSLSQSRGAPHKRRPLPQTPTPLKQIMETNIKIGTANGGTSDAICFCNW